MHVQVIVYAQYVIIISIKAKIINPSETGETLRKKIPDKTPRCAQHQLLISSK